MSLPGLRRLPCLFARHGAGRLGLQGPSRTWRVPSSVTFRPITQSFIRRSEYDDKARALNQKSLDEAEAEVRVRHNQIKRPWHREGADTAPADDEQSDEPMTKGKLLTTPTRLLKLIIPLPVRVDHDKDNKGLDYGRSISSSENIAPLALLVHPQQPLSYVERLIQAELPPIVEDGREKIPNIYFRAENPPDDDGDGRTDKTKEAEERDDEDLPNSPNVASYSGLGHEADHTPDAEKNWVRWSSSTEMGDFIRDAARGREFAIEVEGMPTLALRVGVPSFKDRTHYLRVRLRQRAREVDRLAEIKRECDLLAHRSAHRLAKGGLAALAAWWGTVYYITFLTPYGWDLVEPITYLAGLGTIMGGYLWFLYISRDLSYKAAMNVTVSRRQTALYEERGLDVQRWESLVQEANALRREIKIVAEEYDVAWDEAKDLGGEEVKKVLDKEKRKSEGKRGKDDDEKGAAGADESEKKKAEEKESEEKKAEDRHQDREKAKDT